MTSMGAYWYNFATKQAVWLDESPATDDEAKQFLPQEPAEQGLYRAWRALGFSVLEAMVKTLETSVGGISELGHR